MAELSDTIIHGNLTVQSELHAIWNPGTNILHDASITKSAVFDIFDPVLPIIGDRIEVTGGWSQSPNLFSVSYIERTSSVAIKLYGVYKVAAIISHFESGDGGIISVSLTW